MPTRAGDVGAKVLKQMCRDLSLEPREDLVLECYAIEKNLLFEHDREIALSRIQQAVSAVLTRDEEESSDSAGGDV